MRTKTYQSVTTDYFLSRIIVKITSGRLTIHIFISVLSCQSLILKVNIDKSVSEVMEGALQITWGEDDRSSAVFDFIQSNSNFTDVTLVSDDNNKFHAHKAILGAHSEYFSTLFTSHHDNENQVLLLTGAKAWEVSNLINFMYQGFVNVPKKNVDDLVSLANGLNIKGLISTDKEQRKPKQHRKKRGRPPKNQQDSEDRSIIEKVVTVQTKVDEVETVEEVEEDFLEVNEIFDKEPNVCSVCGKTVKSSILQHINKSKICKQNIPAEELLRLQNIKDQKQKLKMRGNAWKYRSREKAEASSFIVLEMEDSKEAIAKERTEEVINDGEKQDLKAIVDTSERAPSVLVNTESKTPASGHIINTEAKKGNKEKLQEIKSKFSKEEILKAYKLMKKMKEEGTKNNLASEP